MTSSSFKDLSEKFASGKEIGSFEKRARKKNFFLARGSKSSRAAKAVTSKTSKVAALYFPRTIVMKQLVLFRLYS